MKALILAAGYATRLYPLTEDKPKALLPIGGKPILERILEKFVQEAEIDKFYLVSNQKFSSDFISWLDEVDLELNIEVLNDGSISDEDKKGAIGDIQFFLDKTQVKDDLMIIAGDNLSEFPVSNLIKFFKKNGTTVAVCDIGNKENAKRYGVVKIDKNNQIVEFIEKPEEPVSSLVATGFYIFKTEDLLSVGDYMKSGNSPDAPGYYISWLHKKKPVYGYVFKEAWYDIGDAATYKKVNEIYQKK
jgi:glucose-1-phosphate thymidylyltransferase